MISFIELIPLVSIICLSSSFALLFLSFLTFHKSCERLQYESLVQTQYCVLLYAAMYAEEAKTLALLVWRGRVDLDTKRKAVEFDTGLDVSQSKILNVCIFCNSTRVAITKIALVQLYLMLWPG